MNIRENKTCILRTALLWLPVVLWMVVIFLFSAQTGMVSGRLSGGLTARIAAWLTPHWELLSEAERAARLEIWHLVVRKAAHVTEFAVLGGLLMNAWARQQHKAGVRQAGLAALCGLAYAALDEFHQMFVPERGPAVTDVLIDFGGVVIGVLLVWWITRMIFKKHSRSC